MNRLARRIVARYILAGFIPDSFWKENTAKVKKMMSAKVVSPGDIHSKLGELEFFFTNTFKEGILGFDISRAEPTIKDRIENVSYVIDKIQLGYAKFEDEVTKSHPWPLRTPEDEVCWAISRAILDYMEKKVKTLEQAARIIPSTDRRLIQGLAKRLLKKATPEEIASIEAGLRDETFNYAAKYGFYERVGLEKLAAKLISKEKVTYGFLTFIDFLRRVLISNYTDEPIGYRNFDLHGMKVIVDDSTVNETDIVNYVGYLKEALARLRSKGLDRVWYGTVFIKCEACGGVNYNDGGGVGGNYPIGPDVVNVFSRPGPFIVELMAHELGHRYWFKMMTEGQRARFETLIKTHHTSKPVKGLPLSFSKREEAEAKDKISKQDQELVQSVLDYNIQEERWRAHLMTFTDKLYRSVTLLDSIRILQDVGILASNGPKTAAAIKKILEAQLSVKNWFMRADDFMDTAMRESPEPATRPKNVDAYWTDLLTSKIIPQWASTARDRIEVLTNALNEGLQVGIEEFNEKENSKYPAALDKWKKELDEDDRPVSPVSEYGSSNIDEAFAEAFMHYVCEKDMNQDQIESFRTVLKR